MNYPLLEGLGDPLSRDTALALDKADELASFRKEFFIKDENICYLDGNSLGRLPLKTIESVNSFLTEEWGTELVDGWSHWIDEAQPAGDLLGRATLRLSPAQERACSLARPRITRLRNSRNTTIELTQCFRQ